MAIEVGPLRNFYAAEEYHQKYLDKKPRWLLSHRAGTSLKKAAQAIVMPAEYGTPSREILQKNAVTAAI